MKLIFGINLATIIQNWDMTFDLELDDLVIWTDYYGDVWNLGTYKLVISNLC